MGDWVAECPHLVSSVQTLPPDPNGAAVGGGGMLDLRMRVPHPPAGLCPPLHT